DVPDLAAARRFYVEAFGLRDGRRLGDGVLELLGAQAPIYLLQKPTGSLGTGDQPRTYARHWTPAHVDVVVDDLDTALARALDAGARPEGGVRVAAWGWIAQVADRSGHGGCLPQFPGKGYDQITP